MIEILPVEFHFFITHAIASVKLSWRGCPPHALQSMLTGRIFKTQHPLSRTIPTLSSGVAGGTDSKHVMASSWLQVEFRWQNKYHQQSGASIPYINEEMALRYLCDFQYKVREVLTWHKAHSSQRDLSQTMTVGQQSKQSLCSYLAVDTPAGERGGLQELACCLWNFY